jgi:DNA primase small subunit
MVSSREYVYEKFFEFYTKPSTVIPSPLSFAQREFAFLLFKERVMVRHKSFASPKAFGVYIRGKIPSDVYHSCAYYENPDLEMDKKGWLGSDLVFDIDADHIPTSCNKTHDEWFCCNGKCGFSGRGITPELCPICGGVKFEVKTWACDLCIDATRIETRKLLGILTGEFGFSPKEIHIFFSGHRGYHVHVENEAAMSLDSLARKEIVDYVSGIGLSLFDKNKKDRFHSKEKSALPVFRLIDYGWGKRLKKGMREFIQSASKEDFKKIGIRTNVGAILKDKEAVLKRCFEENYWSSVNEVGVETWMRIAEYVKNQESAQIDTVVTSDIHRLIRAAGTLHGKTGMLKIEFPIQDLDCFDPFVGAVAFKEGTAKVLVSSAPEFKLDGEIFGPYKKQTVELPTAAAVLLICKGRAEMVDYHV